MEQREKELEEHVVLEQDDKFFQLSFEERRAAMIDDIIAYFDQSWTCDSYFIETSMWCDASMGNGLKAFNNAMLMAYILNRIPVISVHRMEMCVDQFLTFNTTRVIVQKFGAITADTLRKHPSFASCSRSAEFYSRDAYGGKSSPQCASVHASKRVLYFNDWDEDLHLIMHNKELNREQRARAKRVFALGKFPSMGHIVYQVIDITEKIKGEFLLDQSDYHPPSQYLGPAA